MAKIPLYAKLVFKGATFEIWQWPQKLYDGRTVTFEVAKRNDAVTVIATTAERKIIITELLQPGWTFPKIAFPGGYCENADILGEGKRELLEESGYASAEWSLWKSCAPSERVNWSIHTYIARNARRVSDIAPDGGERITVKLITLDELFDLAMKPEFRHIDHTPVLVEAKFVPEKRRELEALFFGG